MRVELTLAIEVLDGGPSRVKLPSPATDAGTVVLSKAPEAKTFEPCTVDDLHDLPLGSQVSISTRITGGNDQVWVDLTPDDRAALKPMIASMYAAPVIEGPPKGRHGPTPTIGF